MSFLPHSLTAKIGALFFSLYSLLGWNIQQTPVLPYPASTSSVSVTTSTPSIYLQKENTPTVAKNNTSLPYLQIVAPDFEQLPLAKAPVQAPTTPTKPTTPTQPVTPPLVATQSGINQSVVNIFCSSRNGNTITFVTGSGSIVDPKGIIITNSHVAQYVLLSDYYNDSTHTCVARTGSPAHATYKIKVLHLSYQWIQNNLHTIAESNPQGTGQYDYAFLAIVGSVSGSLPSSFPYIPIDTSTLLPQDSISVTGYPAGEDSADTVNNNLIQQSANVSVANVYTFPGDNATDVIVTSPTILAQKGSSGGAIIKDGMLDGIVSTSVSTGGQNNSVSAITTSYISRDLLSSEGESLSALFSGDPIQGATNYENNGGFNLAKQLISSN